MKARKILVKFQRKLTKNQLLMIFREEFLINDVEAFVLYIKLSSHFDFSRKVAYVGGLFYDSSWVGDEDFDYFLAEPRYFSEICARFRGKYSPVELKYILSYERYILDKDKWIVGRKQDQKIAEVDYAFEIDRLEQKILECDQFDPRDFPTVIHNLGVVSSRIGCECVLLGNVVYVHRISEKGFVEGDLNRYLEKWSKVSIGLKEEDVGIELTEMAVNNRAFSDLMSSDSLTTLTVKDTFEMNKPW